MVPAGQLGMVVACYPAKTAFTALMTTLRKRPCCMYPARVEAPKKKGQKERGVYRDLIKRLNAEGISAPRGGTWGTETQVRRELLRLV